MPEPALAGKGPRPTALSTYRLEAMSVEEVCDRWDDHRPLERFPGTLLAAAWA